MTTTRSYQTDARAARLARIEIAADRTRAARDREARRRAEDALDDLERRDLRDAVVLAERALLRIATSRTTCPTTRTIRCGSAR
jgi:hypothetical protein